MELVDDKKEQTEQAPEEQEETEEMKDATDLYRVMTAFKNKYPSATITAAIRSSCGRARYMAFSGPDEFQISSAALLSHMTCDKVNRDILQKVRKDAQKKMQDHLVPPGHPLEAQLSKEFMERCRTGNL